MKRLILFLLLCAAPAVQCALADDASALAALRAACADDAQKLCSNVQSGGGRILACLKEHKDQLSDRCKQAAAQVAGASSPGVAPAPAAALPAAAPPAATKPAAPPRASGSSSSHSASASGDTSSGSFLRLKQVQVIDPGMDKVQAALPAFDLLIPSNWKFTSNVLFGGGKGGCFADFFALFIDATSEDGSIAFHARPDYTWQYADDPSILQKLQDPNRRALGIHGKPCPVAKPMKAEEYFRQNSSSFLAPGSTVISVEPFPELNQIARKRLGLPPGDAGSASARSEAIRVRYEFQQDGQAQEEWLALAIVTRIFPAGRGSFYDCHVVDLVALQAPKGKLDANDRLFKVMVSSIHPEPKWQSYSGAVLAKFYQAEAQKEAIQDQVIANLQNQVANAIMGVTANQFRGSMNSAFGADQGVRGVQTFRDPSNGKTYELSNLYDQAWSNGTDEYLMTNDPNLNPNGKFDGNWNQLQQVHPAP